MGNHWLIFPILLLGRTLVVMTTDWKTKTKFSVSMLLKPHAAFMFSMYA